MNAESSIKSFNKKLQLGKLADHADKMRFFGLSNEQPADYTIRTDTDEKLRSLDEHKISRI